MPDAPLIAPAPSRDSTVTPAASSPGRSRNMRAIKRTGTKPEILVRSRLHSHGHRFRKDYPIRLDSVRVRPDIVFTRKRVAIFVDGCFWHCCPAHGHQPQTNDWYWAPKLQRNRERDELVSRSLVDQGWTVIRVWEHTPAAIAVAEIEHVFDSIREGLGPSTLDHINVVLAHS
ncbi:very short patch repair endonuclease [Leifsonia sp. PS1209]|nr:very short patch repair endonuclease [Leifsonia sp. PS1209]